jgi:hypothetical protein
MNFTQILKHNPAHPKPCGDHSALLLAQDREAGRVQGLRLAAFRRRRLKDSERACAVRLDLRRCRLERLKAKIEVRQPTLR